MMIKSSLRNLALHIEVNDLKYVIKCNIFVPKLYQIKLATISIFLNLSYL